jgi:hypothetical protein
MTLLYIFMLSRSTSVKPVRKTLMKSSPYEFFRYNLLSFSMYFKSPGATKCAFYIPWVDFTNIVQAAFSRADPNVAK